jgi:hypothetical protein
METQTIIDDTISTNLTKQQKNVLKSRKWRSDNKERNAEYQRKWRTKTSEDARKYRESLQNKPSSEPPSTTPAGTY